MFAACGSAPFNRSVVQHTVVDYVSNIVDYVTNNIIVGGRT